MASEIQRGWSNSGRTTPTWKRPKLTPAQRDEIHRRLADGERATALAAEYGVSVRTIYTCR